MRPWVIRYVVPDSWPLINGLDLSIPAYFFFLTLGFMLATNIIIREANRSGESVRDMLDLGMMILVGALVGGRLGHIIFEMPELYIEHPEYIVQFWRGGLVYYGGFIFCTLIVLGFSWKKGLSFWRVADIYAPSVAFGLIFGRMGCLSAGCCYGKPGDFPFGHVVPWAISFYSGQVPRDLRGIPLHPTQIYEAVGCLLIYFFLVRLRKRQKFDGQLIWTFLASYAVLRTFIEIFRFDLDRGVYLDGLISTSQIISFLMLTGAAIAMPYLARKARDANVYGLGPNWPTILRDRAAAETPENSEAFAPPADSSGSAAS